MFISGTDDPQFFGIFAHPTDSMVGVSYSRQYRILERIYRYHSNLFFDIFPVSFC